MKAAPAENNGPKIEKEASLYNGEVTIQRGDFGGNSHAYYWVERGYFVPGVTSVLRILDKPALLQWAANKATDYVRQSMPENANKAKIGEICDKAKSEWRRIRDEAGDIGTQVHAMAEALFNGLPIQVPSDPRAQNGLKALQEWIKANDVRPIEQERIVFSKSVFVAGTMDLLCALNGKLAQVDFKTGSGIYPEHLFQTGMYRDAFQEETGERIELNVIVNLDKKTGNPKILEITDENELRLHADTFKRAKALKENLDKVRL